MEPIKLYLDNCEYFMPFPSEKQYNEIILYRTKLMNGQSQLEFQNLNTVCTALAVYEILLPELKLVFNVNHLTEVDRNKLNELIFIFVYNVNKLLTEYLSEKKFKSKQLDVSTLTGNEQIIFNEIEMTESLANFLNDVCIEKMAEEIITKFQNRSYQFIQAVLDRIQKQVIKGDRPMLSRAYGHNVFTIKR
jgi:hypothetical protein